MNISREDLEHEYCTGCQQVCPERLYESTEARILHQESHDRLSRFISISRLQCEWDLLEKQFWDMRMGR